MQGKGGGGININIGGGQSNFGNVVQGDHNTITGIAPNIGLPGRQIAGARYVFVSHLSEDKTRIARPLEAMMDAGLALWVDRPAEFAFAPRYQVDQRIPAGEDWRRAIDRAVDQAAVILVFWSRHASAGRRDEFMREVRRGMERGNLVQAMLDPGLPSSRDGLFASDQQVDLTERQPAAQYAQRLAYLVSDLRARTG